MVAVISGNGLGLFNSSLQNGLGAGGIDRLGAQGSDRHYVNVATGNLVLSSQDEQLLFRGMAIGHVRTYNSQGLSSQVGDDGWLTGYERRVELLSGVFDTAGSVMRLHVGDGSFQDFTYVGNGGYRSTTGDGAHDTLTYTAGSRSWTYIEGSSRREETYADHADADLRGRLTRIRDLRSDGTTPVTWDVRYDTAGRIAEIRSQDATEGAAADAMVFTYDSSGRLSGVSTRENGVLLGQISYGYDSIGRLTSVLVDLTPQDGTGDQDIWNAANTSANDGNLYRTVYTYTDATSLKISQVRQGDGSVVSYTYDAAGRVATVTAGDPASAHVTLTYVYDVAAGRTDITDDSGRTWSYFHDAQGQLTQIQSPAVDGQRTVSHYAYDSDGNLVQALTQRGAQVLSRVDYQYDTHGNLLWQWTAVDPASGSAATAVQRTYTATHQLASETLYSGLDADGADGGATASGGATTTYLYDAQNRIRFVVGQSGEVIERTYHASGSGVGQLASERRYLGAGFDGTRTLASLEAWATTWQRTNSGLTQYSYDLRGRLSQSQAFDRVAADGSGLLGDGTEITDFAYDAQGLLREKAVVRNPGGQSAADGAVRQTVSYAYDGMGRLLAELVQERWTPAGQSEQVRPLRSTTWTYQDSGSSVSSRIEAGIAGDGTANDLLRTELRNAAGQLLSVTESLLDGSGVSRQTRHYYDATGQLRANEDANGGRTYFFYDAAGRLSGQVDSTGAVLEFVRDGLGRVVSTIAFATRVSTTAWLVNDAVVPTGLSEVRPGASAQDRTATTRYDALGRSLEEAGPDGTITAYTYDGAGRLLQARTTDAAGTPDTARTQRYLYDGTGREVGRLDAAGYLTEFQYDAAGRRTATIAYATASPAAALAQGDLAALRPQPSDGDATVREFHDGRGNLVGMLDAEGYLTEYIYDQARNQRGVVAYALQLTGATLQQGFSTLLAAARQGGTRTTLRSYDAMGQLVIEVSPEGVVTLFSYDAQGHLLHTRTDAAGNDVRDGARRYDAFGNLIGELNGAGAALYDPAMQVSELDALFAQYGVRHVYDALGQRIESIDAEGNRTWYFYDSAGRLTQTIHGVADENGLRNALGEVEETRYSAFGQASETIRYAGHITLQPPFGRQQAEAAVQVLQFVATVDSRRQYHYDRAGRLIEQINAEGMATRTGYNAFGDVVRVEQQVSASDWKVTGYIYDRRGLAVSSTEDVGGLERTTTAQYDAFGRVISSIDAMGRITQFGYDRNGRQVEVARTVSGRLERALTRYDAYGRTLSTTDALGRVTTFAYDDAARSMTLTTPQGLQLVTVYNAHGEQVEIRRPDGYVQRFTYDQDGRLISDGLSRQDAVEGEFDERLQYVYDIRGNLVEKRDLTGAGTVYTYDARGRVLTRVDDGSQWDDITGTLIHDVAASWTYGYDAQGRQISVTDGTGVQTVFAYDREGRLLESTIDPMGLALKTQYSWDGLGNQLSVTEGEGTAAATTTLYVYDGLGRRISEVRAAGSLDLATLYTYDLNDNVVARQSAGGGVARYAYDEAGRLLLSIDELGGVTEQRYDAAGQVTSSRQYATPINLQGLALPASEAQIRARMVADDARDHLAYYRYDADGRQVISVNAAGAVTRSIRDAQGNVVQTRTYAQGLLLSAAQRAALDSGALDANGILAAINADDSRDRIDSYLYDGAGRELAHIDSAGAISRTSYDKAGRVVGTWIVQSQVLPPPHAGIASGTVTLESLGELIDASKGNNHAVDRLYDAAGRLVATITWAFSEDAPNSYDGKVNAPRVQRYIYDAAGRLTSSIDYGVYPDWYYPTFAASSPTNSGGPASWANLPQLLDSILAVNWHGTPLEEMPQRITRHIFDSAGRERFQIGPDGAVVEARLDALDQQVETRRYGQLAENRDWTEAELVAWLADVQDVRISRQAFDAAGRVTARFDALNAAERYVYDALGQLLQYTDKNQATWTYAYDAGGRRISETSPLVAVSIAGVDGSVQTVVRSVVTLNAYDIFGNVIRRTEDAGAGTQRVTEYEYDNRGLQVRTRFPDAGAMNASGQLVATGVRPTVEVTYDLLGRAVMQKDVLGNYSYKTYNSAGQLQFEVDAEGYVTAYTYNTAGEQIELRRYANAIATVPGVVLQSGDVATRLIPEQGRDRILATYYDSAGRKLLVSEITYRQDTWDEEWHYLFGASTKFKYDAYGDMVFEGKLIEEPGGYVYQPGQFESLSYTYTRWNKNAYFYDAAGRRIKQIDSEGFITLWEYNAQGDLIRETQLAEAQWYWDYDGMPGSNKVPTTWGHDRVTEWSYDALGRRVSERQSIGNPADGQFVETTTEYDANGRAIAATVQGQRTETSYDAQGRVTAVRESERDVVNGNADQLLAATSVGLGSQALYRRASPYSTMAYDAFGNVVQLRRYADGVEAGQLAVASARDQVHTTLYDWQGRNVLERDAAGTLYARSYDAADHVLSTRSRLEGNSGRWALVVNEATYDRAGRQLTSRVYRELHQGEGGAVLGIEADATSQVRYNGFGEIIAKDSRLDANLATELFDAQYVYDDNGRLTATNAEGGIWRYYSFDLAGNVTAERHAVRDSTGTLVQVETRMERDHKGQLLRQYTAGNSDQENDYTLTERSYDAWGNVLTLTDALNNITYYEYNQRNQLTRELKPTVRVLNEDGSVEMLAPELLWEYDLTGRLTGTRDANGNWTRSGYDAAGRQTYTEDALGNRTQLAYDAFGQKRYTQDPLGYVTFLEYDTGGRVIAQGDFLREADGLTRSKATRERYALNQNGNRLRVTDALGYVNTFDYDSRGLLTRSLTAAGVAMSYGYDAQGNKIRETNALSDPSLAADGLPVFNGGLIAERVGVVGQSFTHVIPAGAFTTADGEVPALSVRIEYWDAALALYREAAGFSYDATTRTVTGSAGQLGRYRLTYTATSSSGKTASTTAEIDVVSQAQYDSYYSGAPATSNGLFNQSVTAGQPFSYQLPAGSFIDTQGQGLAYSAYVYTYVQEPDNDGLVSNGGFQWVQVGSPEDHTGLSFNGSTATLSGTLHGVQRQPIQIVATGANGRSSTLTLDINSRQVDGRRTTVDDEGQTVHLDELTWSYDYFGRLIDHNDLSGADYDYTYDIQTGQLLGENSKWTEQGRQYATPVNDYWYERDWEQYGMDADQTGLGLPDPVLPDDPARTYTYFRSGALKELKEGRNSFRYEYDANGNRTVEEAYTFDANNQLLHVITRVSYDAHGRITKVTQRDLGNNRRLLELNYDYDAAGNRRRVLARSAYDADSMGIEINGITNPDFEGGEYGWTLGDGWSVVNGGEGNSQLRAQFNLTGDTTLINKQRVEVKAGEVITASARVEQGASSAYEAGAAVFIQWYDAAGNELFRSMGNVVEDASGGAVYDSRLTVEVPWDAAYMSIGAWAYRNSGGDPVFVDDFTWASSPYNGNLDGPWAWNLEDGVTWTYENGGSLEFNRDADTKAIHSATMPVRAGTWVNARANVQQGASSAGTAWGAVFLRFYDAQGNVIADVEGNRVNDGDNGAWHSSYVNKQVPPGAVSMSVGGVAGRSGGHAVWMDDFSWNFEREGDLDPTGNFVDPDPNDPYDMPEPFKVYWYDYDAANRVKVANGRMVDGQIVLGNADISYALDYDDAGRAIRRRYLKGQTEVAELTQYDERGQRIRVFQATALGAEQGAMQDSYSYDATGRVTEQRSYFDAGTLRNGVNISGWLKHAEVFSYDADGRILSQAIKGRQVDWTATAQGDGGVAQVTQLSSLQDLARVDYSAFGYDAAGRLRGYTYQYSLHEEGSGAQASDPKGYTHRYVYSYEARDSYLESRIQGTSTNQNFRASSSYSSYDAWGRRSAVRENTPLASNLGTLDDRIRYFHYDGTGNISQRREGSLKNGIFEQDAGQATQNQLYAYVNGQLVASGKRNGEVDVVGRLTAYQSNNAGGSTRTTVLAGETLRGIAQRMYGNANLWYVLAEANAITDDSGLTAGTTLVVPEVKVTSNDATTFKPFSPQEAIGSTSPNLPYIEPPPKEHCNGFAMVLMVVVAVVAAVFTAGAALMAIGALTGIATTAATTAMAAGWTVVTGSALAGASVGVSAAVAGAAFVGGMAGSIASQAVGKSLGVVDSFSLRSAVAAGVGSVVTAGVANYIGGGQGVSTLLEQGASGYGKVAAMGAVSAAGGYAGGKIAGISDTHFSWRSVAAGAVSSVVAGKINQSLGYDPKPYSYEGIVGGTVTGMVGGVVSLHTRRTFGINDDIDYGAMAADAFGNALGNALIDSIASGISSAGIGAPIREGVPLEGGGLTVDRLSVDSPSMVTSSLQTEPESKLSSVARQPVHMPTLETVRVVGRPYGNGWYFYRQDNHTNAWVDLQKPVRSAPGFSGERPSLWNSYGAATHRAPWQMPGTTSIPYALPRPVAALNPQSRKLNEGYGLKPSDLAPIEHIYEQRQPGLFTTSFNAANELAFGEGSSILDRGVGLVGGTILFVPMLLDGMASGMYNSIDNASVAGQLLAQGHALGGEYEAEYTQRALLTFAESAFGAIDFTGLLGAGRRTLAIGVTEKFVLKEAPSVLTEGSYSEFFLSGQISEEAFQRLNTIDHANNKMRPGEARAAAELEIHLMGELARREKSDPGRYDFIFKSGPYAGKTVDFLQTPNDAYAAQNLNKNFYRNFNGLQGQIDLHLEKAHLVPIGTRHLTAEHRWVLGQYIETLPVESQQKIILLR